MLCIYTTAWLPDFLTRLDKVKRKSLVSLDYRDLIHLVKKFNGMLGGIEGDKHIAIHVRLKLNLVKYLSGHRKYVKLAFFPPISVPGHK